ncbi:radical SAM protein [Candidatus Woesearchaeota archaeon]|nr:radical SAM protein [Candidatus Woesearchaeota archaeon]
MHVAITLAKGLLHSKITNKPFMLSHLVTNRCNLSCPYCIWKRNEPDKMSKEQIKKFYNEAKQEGFKGVFIWGGEPLLREDIPEILEHAKSLKWNVSMATNGEMLEEKAEKIAPYLDTILISIDHPTKHDILRQGKKVYEKAINGIRRIKQCNPGIKCIIATVLTKHNYDQMKNMVELAAKERCFLLVQQMDKGITYDKNTNNKEDATQEQRDKALDMLKKLKKDGHAIINSNTYLNQFHSPKKQYKCKCQRCYLTVYANGSIWGCAQNKPVGNIIETPLKKILSSEEYANFRKHADECSKCTDAGTLENTYLYELKIEPIMNFLKNAVKHA